MSAHVQDDPSRVVVIADELESILHVLIFYTIRFLPHNLLDADVPQFIHDYFDDFSANNHGTRSSLVKRNAMNMGNIKLTSYGDDPTGPNAILQFMWPRNGATPPNFNHPLNHFLIELLSWFRAHYELNMTISKSAPGPNGPSDLHAEEPEAEIPGLDEDEDDVGHPPQRLDCSQILPTVSLQHEGVDEKTRMLAGKLHNHLDMLQLMAGTLQMPWPKDDKTQDKGPKDSFRKDKDPVHSGPWEPPQHFLDAQALEAAEAEEVDSLLGLDAADAAGSETDVTTDDEEFADDEEVTDDEEVMRDEEVMDDEEDEVEEMLFCTGDFTDRFFLPRPVPSCPSTPMMSSNGRRKRPHEEPGTPLKKRSRS